MSNNITRKAGLTLNANAFKKMMNTVYSKDSCMVEFKNKETNETHKKKPNISLSHVALAVCTEKMVIRLLTSVNKQQTPNETTGLIRVSEFDFQTAIITDYDLRTFFGQPPYNYDSTSHYELAVDKKEMTALINGVGRKLFIDDNAMNFLQYLIKRFCDKLIHIAILFVQHSKKRTVSPIAIYHAVQVSFIGSPSDGFSCYLIKELDRVILELKDEKDEDEPQEEHDEHQETQQAGPPEEPKESTPKESKQRKSKESKESKKTQ